MKKRNGFTLVELLAVIVVLAIIMIIAIPNILDTMNSSKKSSFYLYAQSMQEKAIAKYTQDLDSGKTHLTDCAIYDIAKDLGLKNTGSYEGWAKVHREAVSSGDKAYKFTLTTENEIQQFYYCLSNDGACEPNKTTTFESTTIKGDNGAKSNKYTFAMTIPAPSKNSNGVVAPYQMKFYYKYVKPKELSLNSSDVYTIDYAGGGNQPTIGTSTLEDIVDGTDYMYYVTMTLRTDNYAVENFVMTSSGNSNTTTTTTLPSGADEDEKPKEVNKNSEQEQAFYDAIEAYKKKVQDKTYSAFGYIVGPTCSADAEAPVLLPKGSSTCQNSVPTKFNITFEPNGGTAISGSLNKIEDANGGSDATVTMDLPEVTKNGYQFDGWYYDKKFTDPVKNGKVQSYTLTNAAGCVTGYADVTLYAKFSKVSGDPKERSTKTATDVTTKEIQVVYPITNAQGEVLKTEALQRTTVDITDNTILLNSLDVSGYQIGFETTKFEYKVTVPYDTTSLNISAVPFDATTLVTTSGHENLSVGTNYIIVNLYNPDNNHESNYIVKALRLDEQGKAVDNDSDVIFYKTDDDNTPDPTLESSDATLRRLFINGYTLDYSKGVYEYTLEVAPETTQLDIETTPTNTLAMVYIEGNSDLEDGSIVDIQVTSANKFYTKHYKIHIIKPKAVTKSKKIVTGILIGSGVILLVTSGIVYFTKTKKIRPDDKDDKNDIYRTDENGNAVTDANAVSDTGVAQVAVDKNPNDFVGTQPYQQPVNNVFNQGATSEPVQPLQKPVQPTPVQETNPIDNNPTNQG